MSSFICSSKHFNSIGHAINMLTYGSECNFPYSFKNRIPILYDNRRYSAEDIEKEVRNIVDTLREINVLCVSLQYKHHYEGVLDAEIKEQMEAVKEDNGFKSLSKVALLKALRCLNYQIEIEHLKELRNLTEAEEKALFFVSEMSNQLAYDIATSLPTYDKADWEIN